MTDHMCPRACRALWIAVIETALGDLGSSDPVLRHRAGAWFASGPDMLRVAALAGLDGSVIRQRYLRGQIIPPVRQGPKRTAA